MRRCVRDPRGRVPRQTNTVEHEQHQRRQGHRLADPLLIPAGVKQWDHGSVLCPVPGAADQSTVTK